MRWIINYIRSCFCEHEWELIFDGTVGYGDRRHYRTRTYRCTKCGYSQKYDSN